MKKGKRKREEQVLGEIKNKIDRAKALMTNAEETQREKAANVLMKALVAEIASAKHFRTMTGMKKTADQVVNVNVDNLKNRWRVLAEHYGAENLTETFETGVMELEKWDEKTATQILNELSSGLETLIEETWKDQEIHWELKHPFGIGPVKVTWEFSINTIKRTLKKLLKVGAKWGFWIMAAVSWIYWVAFMARVPIEGEGLNTIGVISLAILLTLGTLMGWALTKKKSGSDEKDSSVGRISVA